MVHYYGLNLNLKQISFISDVNDNHARSYLEFLARGFSFLPSCVFTWAAKGSSYLGISTCWSCKGCCYQRLKWKLTIFRTLYQTAQVLPRCADPVIQLHGRKQGSVALKLIKSSLLPLCSVCTYHDSGAVFETRR